MLVQTDGVGLAELIFHTELTAQACGLVWGCGTVRYRREGWGETGQV